MMPAKSSFEILFFIKGHSRFFTLLIVSLKTDPEIPSPEALRALPATSGSGLL
jgi:hypothetical protein